MVVTPRSGRFNTENDPLYKRMGGPPGPVCTGADNPPIPGFDTRPVQSVTSRYNDHTISDTFT
jgi:hypothetical protein